MALVAGMLPLRGLAQFFLISASFDLACVLGGQYSLGASKVVAVTFFFCLTFTLQTPIFAQIQVYSKCLIASVIYTQMQIGKTSIMYA